MATELEAHLVGPFGTIRASLHKLSCWNFSGTIWYNESFCDGELWSQIINGGEIVPLEKCYLEENCDGL